MYCCSINYVRNSYDMTIIILLPIFWCYYLGYIHTYGTCIILYIGLYLGWVTTALYRVYEGNFVVCRNKTDNY